MWLLGFWGSNRLGEGPGELPLPVTSPQNVFLPKSESSQAQERMSFQRGRRTGLQALGTGISLFNREANRTEWSNHPQD